MRYLQVKEKNSDQVAVILVEGLPTFVYAKESCKHCYGTGWVGVQVGCNRCMGSGKVKDRDCPKCRGTGNDGDKKHGIPCQCVKHERELE